MPRCPYEVLRTDKYDSLINRDLFLQLVRDCYAWSIWQFIQMPKKDGTYRDIPGTDLYYSGDFPLWRLSYVMIGYIPYAARELIKAIYVGKVDKSTGKRRQEVRIEYDFIGYIPLDKLLKEVQT